jgi:protein-disulfide isomerase
MLFRFRVLLVLGTALELTACSGGDDVRRPVPSPPASLTRHVPAVTAPPQEGRTAGETPRRVELHGIDLTGVGYDEGDPSAPIVVVNFSDFGCPYCGTYARETHPVLAREYIATGKVFFKYVPFVMGMFPNGDKAARAAECAAEQGQFAAMHDQLYAEQRAWKRGGEPERVFARAATRIGLDQPVFAACVRDGAVDARTAVANDRAMRLNIRATPTFFIDGRQVEGALPLLQFRQVLDELAR